MDAPLTPADALIRPWRTATLVASLVAAIELVLLVGAAILLLAKPLSHALEHHAQAAAVAPVKKAIVHVPKQVVGKPKLTRAQTHVYVLNGNGRAGAAASEASKLHSLGYGVRGAGNASRQDYATTVIMFKPHFHAEGVRLAHDLHVQVVGPLDGLSPAALHGAQLVVLLGAA